MTVPDGRSPGTVEKELFQPQSTAGAGHIGAPDMLPQTADTTELVTVAARKIEGRSPWRLSWERLRRDRIAMISLGVIIFMALLAIFAPLVSHFTGHPPNHQYLDQGTTTAGLPKGPTSQALFGYDDLGRDILVRVAYGARISLLVGVIATSLAVAIGVVIGMAAGYFRGWVDNVLARFIDVMLAFPVLLFAISLASVLHPSLKIVIIVVAIFSWASVARIVRGQVLSIREKEYVEAARSLGASDWRIMFHDILPNTLAPIIVYATLLFPTVIVFEATLSFLGVGVPDPTADWGAMISSSETYYQVAWWYLTFPSLFLLLTTLAFNLLGDGVRDAFDPRGDRHFAA